MISQTEQEINPIKTYFGVTQQSPLSLRFEPTSHRGCKKDYTALGPLPNGWGSDMTDPAKGPVPRQPIVTFPGKSQGRVQLGPF